jgi:hypothetical protein
VGFFIFAVMDVVSQSLSQPVGFAVSRRRSATDGAVAKW